MNYSDAHSAMVNAGLDVQAVLKAMKTEYRELVDSDKWPAATNAKDSKGMNKNYGAVNMASTDQLRKMVHALVQNAPSGKKQGNCHNCGSPDHWARECPQNKNKRFNSRNKSARNNPGRGGSRGTV